MKARITRNGMYLYHRSWTLSFNWRVAAWHWCLHWHPSYPGGMAFYWGWWSLELTKWSPGDEWGEGATESMLSTLDWAMDGAGVPDPEMVKQAQKAAREGKGGTIDEILAGAEIAEHGDSPNGFW